MPLTTDHLAELIGRKHECLRQLHELGRQQLALVEAGDITALVKVLSAKQQLIAVLKQIESGLDPFRCELPEERVWRSDEDRARCAAEIERSEILFREILAQEKRGEQLLQRRRDEAAQQLQGAHAAGQARGAYAVHQDPRASRHDLAIEG